MVIHSAEFDTLLPVGGICMSHQEQRDSDNILHDHCAGERKEETQIRERDGEGGKKRKINRERGERGVEVWGKTELT